MDIFHPGKRTQNGLNDIDSCKAFPRSTCLECSSSLFLPKMEKGEKKDKSDKEQKPTN